MFLIQSLFLSFSAFIGYHFYSFVKLSDFAPVIDSLQDISVMVFTIMGLWVAFIYPSALKALTNPGKVRMIEGTDKTKRLEDLITAILISASVLLGILLFTFLELITKQTVFYKENESLLKAVSLSFLAYLCLVQSKAVMSVIINNIRFVNELHSKRNEQEMHQDL